MGPDAAWRLLTAYVFEEADYVASAADDARQAVAYTRRRLPDVVVMPSATPDAFDILAELSADTRTAAIPVVVLTAALHSPDASRVRAAGGVTLLPHTGDLELLVGEVDTLIAVAPRARRTLARRLLDLQELARYYTPDADGHAHLRRLIDHLQVAIFAVDERGQCIAASEGAIALTGYSRQRLLTASVFHAGFAGGHVSDAAWRRFLANRHYAGTTTITTRAGADVTVHAAAVAAILPGLHVAAFAAA